MALLSFLDRENTVAGPGYSRWLFPPAALAVHMCIGQAYGLSVFNIPLSRLIGITESAPGDWSLTATVQVFNFAFFFLGVSAALFGKWVERSGPRKTMLASALFFTSGFLVSALGIRLHSLPVFIGGYGVLGGIGLGLGYISPVSTLMKWFPDRPGMATGLAIMGFGGGAMIGSPLAVALMKHYQTPTSTGVWETFATMGVIYFCFMLFGVIVARVPAADWKPAGWTPTTDPSNKMITTASVTADTAIKTPQFWLLWAILCLNVTAGIGVLSQASPMIQEVFSTGRLGLGRGITAEAAAGFVGLLSLFNLIGRFFWSSLSDRTGRKRIYMIYLGLGALLYTLIPTAGSAGSPALFVAIFCVILSMYGAGFSTIPAYLRDMFGTLQVGAIHGRLLTAWSTAAIVGPNLVAFLREYYIGRGKLAGLTESVAKADAYNTTMYIMASLLVIGFICNLLVKPVADRYQVKDEPKPVTV
ncbi:OFA family MFS transporter [Spirosoma utsteinense]|uniref:MFS family permease n=1 Tax=Spirosoma utsteinense TaxID=2585773 RepID=A0ABR6WCD9_9BACT|nr:OFA family MFS transporter [Spirosoma utsteinense]MBC3786460.1 MFS family permease [Spirosoma utsteinense]MBC3793828.1 MFS family permease [Spirosoma utsteinense]